MKERPVSRD